MTRLPSRSDPSADEQEEGGNMHAVSEELNFGLLLDQEPSPHLTVTMPTHRFGKETRDDRRRFERLLNTAELRLEEASIPSIERAELLKPLHELGWESSFWDHQDEGLVALTRPGMTLPVAVPYSLDEEILLADRFAVRPLLPILFRPARFYVLALSSKTVRLVSVSQEGISRLQLPDLPQSMKEALGYDQFYSGTSVHSGGPAAQGQKAGIVHGHGDDDEERGKQNLLAFFRRVAEPMRKGLPSEVPWVLACIGSHVPLFQEAARDDPRLQPYAIRGNPDDLADEELVDRARPLLQDYEDGAKRRALERAHRLAGNSKLTGELTTVVGAARHGRVDSLFVTTDERLWGTFEPDTGTLEIHDPRQPGDEELVDASLFYTLKNGGEVFQARADELPLTSSMVAVLRF